MLKSGIIDNFPYTNMYNLLFDCVTVLKYIFISLCVCVIYVYLCVCVCMGACVYRCARLCVAVSACM